MHTSGDTHYLDKCAFYNIKWKFNKDGTHYINKISKEALVIESSSTGTKHYMKLLDNYTSFTYLLVTSAPNESPKHELKSLKNKSKVDARTLSSSHLTRYQSHISQYALTTQNISPIYNNIALIQPIRFIKEKIY